MLSKVNSVEIQLTNLDRRVFEVRTLIKHPLNGRTLADCLHKERGQGLDVRNDVNPVIVARKAHTLDPFREYILDCI